MFVTNLAQHPLGVDGIIILKPGEQNRFIEETEDLVDRVKRLASVGLAQVRFEEGLVKDGLPKEEAPKVVKAVEPAPEPQETKEEATEEEPTNAEEEPAAKPKARGGRGAK